jgi:hypothetical protein
MTYAISEIRLPEVSIRLGDTSTSIYNTHGAVFRQVVNYYATLRCPFVFVLLTKTLLSSIRQEMGRQS